MIKNIVFDMGNVLVAYDGRKVCKHYIKDKKDRKRVFTAIFQSPEWVYLDMGMIPEEQAVDQMCAVCRSGFMKRQDCVCGIGISII